MSGKSVESKDLYKFVFPSEVKCSPDGKHVAFILNRADEETDGYKGDIWILEPEKGKESVRSLTSSGDVKAFAWEDEKTVLFISGRKGKKPGTTDFYRISVCGGEAEEAFTVPEAVGMPVKLENGKSLVSVKRPTDHKKAEPDRAEESKDYWTFTDKPFIRDGEPFGERRRLMLALYDGEKGSVNAITPEYFEVSGVSVSPAKDKVLYYGDEYKDYSSGKFHKLCEYDVKTGETRTLVEAGKLQISIAEYCANGILLQASDMKKFGNQNHDLYLIKEDGKLEKLASPDGMYTSAIDIDVTYGGGKKYKICGNRLIGARLARTETEFDEVNTETGEIRKIGCTDAYTCLDVSGSTIYTVALCDYRLSEIYSMDISDGSLKSLTDFGGEYLSEHEISAPEPLSFISSNGEKVDGFVIKPVSFDENKKYPAVLMIHGGPKWAYSGSFMHQMQFLASKGMFVFFCNPHGGDGYGESFLKLTGHWGDIDYRQIMEFTDECLKHYPQMDSERLGVTGGSYGGYMTNWIIGHTDRFKAAVSQRGICNVVSECLIVDIGDKLMSWMAGDKTPWSDEQALWDISPLKYVKNVKTPTLFIHSDRDFRCFSGEPMQMFTALKQLGVPSEFILFHGDSHGLSRSGRPSHRVARLEAIADWLLKYL